MKFMKNKISLANIENNAYICKCKTLLSLLNKQTSGLLFFYIRQSPANSHLQGFFSSVLTFLRVFFLLTDVSHIFFLFLQYDGYIYSKCRTL